MYQIDFLKKQGLPVKHRPIEIGLYTAGVLVLAIILLALPVKSTCNKSVLKARQGQLARLEAMASKPGGQGSVKLKLERDLETAEKCRLEVAGAIGRYVEWTGVLKEFANSLPGAMILNEMAVVRTAEKQSVTSSIDPTKKTDIEIIKRTIKSSVYDFTPGETSGIKMYLESLRAAQSLKGMLSEAYIAESSDGECKEPSGKVSKVKNYVINCLLKGQGAMEAK